VKLNISGLGSFPFDSITCRAPTVPSIQRPIYQATSSFYLILCKEGDLNVRQNVGTISSCNASKP
jgi:hypothetical protein